MKLANVFMDRKIVKEERYHPFIVNKEITKESLINSENNTLNI